MCQWKMNLLTTQVRYCCFWKLSLTHFLSQRVNPIHLPSSNNIQAQIHVFLLLLMNKIGVLVNLFLLYMIWQLHKILQSCLIIQR